MLVYSYYSSQIIVTTDERRSGPVALPPEVGPSIAACWRAPHQGDQVTVQLSFRRDGSIFGKPRVNYVKPMNSSSAQAITESIFKALDACLPLRFTPRLAANIAGQVFVIDQEVDAAGAVDADRRPGRGGQRFDGDQD